MAMAMAMAMATAQYPKGSSSNPGNNDCDPTRFASC
jgi:hypothetical protein